MTTKSLLHLPLIVVVALVACGDDSSPTSSTPVPTPPPAQPVSMDPELTSSAVKIVRSSGNYHYISWKFTVDSPKKWDYGYVMIRWFDDDGFQVEWSNWLDTLRKGVHTYTDETMCRKDIWATVVRRTVRLERWWDN